MSFICNSSSKNFVRKSTYFSRAVSVSRMSYFSFSPSFPLFLKSWIPVSLVLYKNFGCFGSDYFTYVLFWCWRKI